MSNKTILIVEDDLSIRELLSEFLEFGGFKVYQAEHGLRAIELLSKIEHMPDLVLLDVMMPVMDGLKFYDHLQMHPNYHKLPVIMMTANPSLINPEIRKKVSQFLVKPINLNALLDFISSGNLRPSEATASF
jgi:CheY-like chemotaxis protein